MDEQADPGILVPETQPVSTPTPEQVAAAETILHAAQAHPAIPAEDTWLLHYSGTEPLEKDGYTWQPDQVIPVPESVARRLFGGDQLRVVRDIDLFNAMRERPNG